MNTITTLLKLGTAFAAGRASRELSGDDLRRYAGDVRRYAGDATDDALHRMGLQRTSTVPSLTLPVLGALGAGMVVGVGMMLFIDHTELGRDLRGRIFREMGKTEDENKATTDEAKAEAETPTEEQNAKAPEGGYTSSHETHA